MVEAALYPFSLATWAKDLPAQSPIRMWRSSGVRVSFSIACKAVVFAGESGGLLGSPGT